jgi:hypothetical protein
MMLLLPAAASAIVCGVPAAHEPVKAVRGLASQVEVDYAPRLRPRADLTPASPMMIRVSPGKSEAQQRIEFIGAVAGSFDLRDFLEREDGKPLSDLTPLPVAVLSRLPSDHGTDLYSTSESWLNWRAHYRELMWGAVALWVAVPATVLLVRAARRPRPAPPAPAAPPPPTLAEQLRAALETARDHRLTVDESARLELLLYRYLSGDEPAEGADVAALLRDIREHEATRPLVLAVERWLHAKDGGEEARTVAAAALDQLRRERLAPATPAARAPAEATP